MTTKSLNGQLEEHIVRALLESNFTGGYVYNPDISPEDNFAAAVEDCYERGQEIGKNVTTDRGSEMRTENIQRLISMVRRLNPNCNEIGAGMMAQMKEVADAAEEEIHSIYHESSC
jgi:hypothetical protein